MVSYDLESTNSIATTQKVKNDGIHFKKLYYKLTETILICCDVLVRLHDQQTAQLQSPKHQKDQNGFERFYKATTFFIYYFILKPILIYMGCIRCIQVPLKCKNQFSQNGDSQTQPCRVASGRDSQFLQGRLTTLLPSRD